MMPANKFNLRQERRSCIVMLASMSMFLLIVVFTNALWVYALGQGWAVRSLPITPGHDGSFLITEQGPLHYSDPVAQELLGIVFPGYEAHLRRLHSSLNEDDQFSIVSLLLSTGRQMRVNIPFPLPFELAKRQQPDLLIFGSSRSREGLRADALVETLGLERGINASTSGASMQMMELMSRHFVKLFDGRKVKYLIVELSDVSLLNRPERTAVFRKKLLELNQADNWRSHIAEFGRELRALFPRLMFKRYAEPAVFESCDNQELMRKELAISSEEVQKRFADRLVDPEEVASFRRSMVLWSQIAEQIVFVRMPVTDVYHSAIEHYEKDYISAIQQVLNHQRWLDQRSVRWNVDRADYFSAKGSAACELDLHHLNPLAAIKISRQLGEIIKDNY